MLRFLRIRALAVIDTVDLEFSPGFNVLTGETGAGKSILVEAVGLLLGGRASPDLVRSGAETASVEAIFEVGDRELLVRRDVTSQGRSRAFVDGDVTTLAGLRHRMNGLVELHGQHEHQTLLDPAAHLGVLDTFAGHDALLMSVADAFESMRRARHDLEEAQRSASDRQGRLELLSFQLDELNRAELKAGEDEELESAHRVLANADRIERLCRDSYAALYEEDGAILARLGAVWRQVGELASLAPEFRTHLDARDGIKAQLEELAALLRQYGDRIDASPARLQQVEDRLALLHRLKKKYGPTLGDVITRRDGMRREVERLSDPQSTLDALHSAFADARRRYYSAAGALSSARKKAADAFAVRVRRELSDLAMAQTRFEARFGPELSEDQWSAAGVDQMEFFLSPNPGEDLRSLARIASGGELSRIMLAIKMLGRAESASMVFDEVDAGIGGRVAEVVGKKLCALGERTQVLCITHLPQIAAQARTHFHVAKAVERGRTKTSVFKLDERGRIEEIGRMLGGSHVSDGIRASAAELLRLGSGASDHGAKMGIGESERAKAKVQRSAGARQERS